MTTKPLLTQDEQVVDEAGPRRAHWIMKESDAIRAAQSADRTAVWIVRGIKAANWIGQGIRWPIRRAGYLVLLQTPRPELLAVLMRRYERVAYGDEQRHFLHKAELVEVLESSDRKDRFIGGMVDGATETTTLWRGDLSALVVPFSAFAPTANGVIPDWSHFGVADYGHTVRFGPYEAASDAVLYEYDADFRRRQNALRRASERTLGASIRRLRKQKGLTRNHFPGLDPKTLTRIEQGQVVRPQAKTLLLIANRLDVALEELGTY